MNFSVRDLVIIALFLLLILHLLRGSKKAELKARDMVLVSLFAALTAVMALFVSIPLPFVPVPLTGQTFAVMLSGALLGSRRGAYSQVVYVLLGATGIPVFAGGLAGLSVLVGPRGGFLFGFILGAYVIGKMVERKNAPSPAYLFLATTLGGVLAVYIPGILQLSLVTGMTLPQAALAMVWFLPGDAIKVAASSLLAWRILSTGILHPAQN